MPQWSIGPIVGQYQPENFTEKQSVNYEEPKAFGIVPPLIFKNFSPREVTLSFVVNVLATREASERAVNNRIHNARDQSDPEVVWATICAMMRAGDRVLPPPLLGGLEPAESSSGRSRNFPRVMIPGWNVGGNTPTHAVVTDASFQRTHIAGRPPRCVRGVITVTLREKNLFINKNVSRRTAASREQQFQGFV